MRTTTLHIKRRQVLFAFAGLSAGALSFAQSRREMRVEEANRPVGFRLAVQQVRWVDDPEIPIRFTGGDRFKDMATEHVNQVRAFLRADAQTKVEAELKRLQALGNEHILVLRPVVGFQDAVDGLGTGVHVRVEVFDLQDQLLWKADLRISGGLQPFGPKFHLPKPDIVNDLVYRLMWRLHQVDLVSRP